MPTVGPLGRDRHGLLADFAHFRWPPSCANICRPAPWLARSSLLFAVVSFGWLYPEKSPRQVAQPQGEWQPFSLERLEQVAVDDGRTVLVDFSAEWCLNCKLFETTVLHTEAVEASDCPSGAVSRCTPTSPSIRRRSSERSRRLGSNGVPVIAIFPGDSPYEPIVFRGGYTQQELVAVLEKATGRRLQGGGPSVAEASTVPSL